MTAGPAGTIDTIGVVVPARNEQELLPACLRGLSAASERCDRPVTVVVVLDRCTDGSQLLLDSWQCTTGRLVVLVSDRGNVGYARDLGARWLVTEYGSDSLWLANTDADSVVPPSWFERQLAHAAEGAHAVAGTVELDTWAGHSVLTRDRYLQAYDASDGHRHTHGANLSMTAGAYVAANGFPVAESDEDVVLVERLIGIGATIAWAADLPVRTSGRDVGRAPRGFAGYLRLLSREPAPIVATRPAALIDEPDPTVGQVAL